MPISGSWIPTVIRALHYGPGSVEAHLLSLLPSPKSKAFIVTGNSLATKTTLIKDVENLLKEHHAATFSRIGQHAPVAQLDEATEQVLQNPDIDTVISIGGGSPIDSAKVLSFRVHAKTGSFLRHIAIPTTISAAECTAGAGYTSKDGLKIGVKVPQLSPEAVLYDSKFALKTPPELWLSTGLRAMDHAVETMYHPDMSELTKMIAIQAAAKLFIYLPRYKRDPTDQDTITQLQLAAFASLGYAGNGLKQSLGLSHTLGYALGSPYGIPHGITSCLTLGHVVKLKAQDPGAAEELARMAAAVGIRSSGSARADAEALGQKILQLVDDLGLKGTLAERGVGSDQLSIIVKRATGADSGPVFDRVSELVKSLL